MQTHHLREFSCNHFRPVQQPNPNQKVLHNVLKAPEHLQYQLAFLSSVRQTLSSKHGLKSTMCSRGTRNYKRFSIQLRPPLHQPRSRTAQHPIARKSPEIARSASQNSNLRRKKSYGAKPPAATTSTRLVSSNGPKASRGKKSAAFTGKLRISLVQIFGSADTVEVVLRGRGMRIRLRRSRREQAWSTMTVM